MAASKGFLFVVLPQLRSSMNNKAPIDREASGESDPPLLPQIDFLQVDGLTVGRTADDDYEHRSDGAEWSEVATCKARNNISHCHEEVMAEFIKMISIVSRMNGGRGGVC